MPHPDGLLLPLPRPLRVQDAAVARSYNMFLCRFLRIWEPQEPMDTLEGHNECTNVSQPASNTRLYRSWGCIISSPSSLYRSCGCIIRSPSCIISSPSSLYRSCGCIISSPSCIISSPSSLYRSWGCIISSPSCIISSPSCIISSPSSPSHQCETRLYIQFHRITSRCSDC